MGNSWVSGEEEGYMGGVNKGIFIILFDWCEGVFDRVKKEPGLGCRLGWVWIGPEWVVNVDWV